MRRAMPFFQWGCYRLPVWWCALPIVLATLSACGAAQPEASAEPAAVRERPNILFIYTDDQAPWAMSAARGAHPQARTPNMDRIAREGAYLPNSFTATPVCSPSRAELLTSRYGTELGITEWIEDEREPGHGLPAEIVTWSDVLQQAGYTTGLLGKWHLGVLPRYHPTRAGFDYFMGFQDGGTTPRNPLLDVGGTKRRIEGFTTEILTDTAIGFLRDNRNRPFSLSVHYRAPHRPWRPLPDEDWAPYRELDPEIPNPDYPKLDIPRLEQLMPEYLASVASVDRNVGRILRALDDLGLAENTVVIFSSDNGYNLGHSGIWHKGNAHWILTEPPPGTNNVPQGQRPNMYDRSLRIPTAVRWPGRIRPGTVIEETVSNLDWYPTLLAMAGVELPAGVLIRGRSFLPLLSGREIPDWDNDFYAEYSTHHQSWTHMRAYRTPEWKLVRDFLNPRRDELYDLATDPAETTNLIDSTDPEIQRVIERLGARILAKMRELDDPVLYVVKKRTDEPAR